MTIIPLIEDSPVRGFEHERGLSLYIETKDGHRLIFDLGLSGRFIDNALKLGIDLDDVDYFIASHGHKDHFGGLDLLPDHLKGEGRVLFAREALDLFSFTAPGFSRSIGNNTHLDLKGLEFNDIYQIEEDIYLIRSKKRIPSEFFKKGGKPDDFEHEIHLVVREGSSLNIVTGCCHSGVFNLLHTLRDLFPEYGIKSLTGGIHTRSYILKPLVLYRFIRGLRRYNISHLLLGHCTGRATRFILSISLKGVVGMKTGRRYTFSHSP